MGLHASGGCFKAARLSQGQASDERAAGGTGHAGDMDVELLVMMECPHEAVALALTMAALDELDVAASVTTTVMESDEQAQVRGFAGSPTFLINGRDPFAAPSANVATACRVYRTPTGLAGVPSLEELREALRREATA